MVGRVKDHADASNPFSEKRPEDRYTLLHESTFAEFLWFFRIYSQSAFIEPGLSGKAQADTEDPFISRQLRFQNACLQSVFIAYIMLCKHTVIIALFFLSYLTL